MEKSDFTSDKSKNEREPADPNKLSGEIKRWIEKIDRLNGDRLEIKSEMALKNKFITPQQEKELFSLVNDDTLHSRYSGGEVTPELLSQLKNFHHQLKRKKDEIFPDVPQGKKLKLGLVKKGGGNVNNKEKNMLEKKEPLSSIKSAEKKQEVSEPDQSGILIEKLSPGESVEVGMNIEREADLGAGELAKNQTKKSESTPASAVLEKKEAEKKSEANEIGEVPDTGESKSSVIEKKKMGPPTEAKTGVASQETTDNKKERPVEKISAEEMLADIRRDDIRRNKGRESSGKSVEADDSGKNSAEKPEEVKVEVPGQEVSDKKKEAPVEQKKEEKIEDKNRLSAEELKKTVEKARAEYIKSEIEAKKADKSFSKLRKIREFLFTPEFIELIKSKNEMAETDKEEIKKLNEEKRVAYEEAKKVFAKGLYDEHMKSFEEMAKEGGASREPIKSEHREILLAKLKFDVVRASILDERENFNNAKFEALPKKEQGLCRKAMARYGQLPPWSKVLISAGVATGATVAFSSGVGFAMVGGVFAWKALRAGVGTTAGLLAGKGYNWAFDKMIDVKNIKNKGEQEIINEIERQLSSGGGKKEKVAEGKKEEEFGKWFTKLSSSTNEKLDKLAAKEKRILLGKAIGQGIVIAGVAGATSWGMERIGANLGLSPTANLARPKVSPENVPKAKAAGILNSDEGVAKSNAANILDSHKVAARVDSVGIESAKVKEVLNFKIGARGPEGAIIDNFKANPKLAESFGYKPESGISLDKWAGSKAHELWSKSAEADLKNPKIIAELAKHGYQANPEDYAKAMHKIGKGFVELDSEGGHMHLSDETSFLKVTPPSIENPIALGDQVTTPEGANLSKLASVEPMQGATEIKPLSGAENLMNSRIKETVARLFKPEILTDKTFKVAAKVPLSKILEAVPPEVYENKYSLSHYWLNLDHEVGLPGSSWLGVTYDDFRKYSEMAKFLREEAGVGVAEKLKDMTVEDFFKTYGDGLIQSVEVKSSASGLTLEGEINLPESTPGVKINLPEPVRISGEVIAPPVQESIDVFKPESEMLVNPPEPVKISSEAVVSSAQEDIDLLRSASEAPADLSQPDIEATISNSNGLTPEGEINLPEPTTPEAPIGAPEPVETLGAAEAPLSSQESISPLEPAPEEPIQLGETLATAEAPVNPPELVETSGQEAIINEPAGVSEVLETQSKVSGTALETATVATEKQEIIENLIGSRASVSMAAVKRLTAGVKAGDLSVEDVANYYAQNIKTDTPAVTLTPENMNQFRETFSTAVNGSGAAKMKSLDTIRIMLERLRQNK